MRAAGFVLVGGRSSRMGRNKALLPWRDSTLVHEIAAKVLAAAGSVALVGPSQFPDAPRFDCVADLRPGFGPLSGIEGALASGRGELNLIVSCDLPLLDTQWLKHLLEEARSRNEKCLMSEDSEGRLHPLCAVYRSDCLPAVRMALDSGHLRLMDVVEELGAAHVRMSAPLWNVNTPEDWERYREFANAG